MVCVAHVLTSTNLQRKEMAKCIVESCCKETRKYYKYCSIHQAQVNKFGMVTNDRPSYRDPNEIIDCGNGESKVVLRNKDGYVVGYSVIDTEKVGVVKDKKWYLHSSGYAACRSKAGSFYMHRLIYRDAKEVDHINMDKLDNRVSNLRACCQSENIANTNARKSSKTGVKGVHIGRSGKFIAQITKDRKVYSLGTFVSIDDAKNAYADMAKKLFGEFARC